MAKHTKRAATIAPTNNDNRPSVSTLRVSANSEFSELPPPDSIYGLYDIKHFILDYNIRVESKTIHLRYLEYAKLINNSQNKLFPRSFFPPPIPHSGNHPRQLVHHEAHLAVERRHNNDTFTGGTQHTFTLALKEKERQNVPL